MKKNISDSDIETWETFINSNDKIPDKDTYKKEDEVFASKTLDLHGYNIRDANATIENLIISSYNNGTNRLNIITGKGLRSKNLNDPYSSKDLGILKYAVPNFIKNNKHLIDKIKHIDEKEINDLNKGSFTIILKKNETRHKK